MTEALISTAVGEFSSSYLAKEAGKNIAQFIAKYGSAAFQRVAPLVTGGMIFEAAVETYPDVDLQKEKLFGTSLSSLPGMPTGPVYSDIEEPKKVEPLKFGQWIGPDADEMERQKEEIRKLTKSKGFPAGPIAPVPPLITPIPEPKKIEPKDDTPVELPELEGFPIHEQKTWRDYILTQDKPKDITKQTEELVSGTEEDFTEGLKEYEEVYSPERFKKANDEYPELSPANNKKIVEADKHFGARALAREYGHNTGETQLIYLSPQEYLDLTKQFGRIDGTWSPGGKAIIKYLEGKIKDGKEIGEIPILSVSKQGENYLVNGQEGRHRAQAFKNQGYNKIPVRIEGSGKNKESGVENKVYTATPKSYLYKEDWAQKYLNFIPKKIISESDYNKDTEQYESWESKSVKPGDFYDVASKKKLFVKEDITKQTKDLVKEKPEFGALTEVEKQTAIALKGDKPDYYSRVVKAISDHKQDKMSAGEWKNVIGIQGTKDEMDFLGLTKKLQGDKSITKEDLLAEVSAKDIAPKIYVTSIPKEDWVSEFGEHSLGFEKEGTQEQIVFQIDTLPKTEADIEFGLSGMEYQAPSAHVIEKHGRNQIAHARTQVGYGDPDAPPADIGEKGREVSEKLKNTLIIDEIQSDWIQRIQKYGTKDEPKAKVLKGSEITPQFIKENFGDFYDLKIEKFKTQKDLLENTGLSTNKVLYSTDKATGMRGVVKRIDEDLYYVFTYKGLTSESKSVAFSEKETAIDHAKDFAASNLPIKKSKKYVELVLREMIKKATNDGRDSIAITNGNIQLDRSKEEGNKWFYDNIVLGELEKIAKQYGVKVETINIEPDKYLKLQENLKKIEAKGFEETTVTANDLKNYLNARTNVGATLPDFREVIMNEGVSFRGGYFDQMLNTQHPQHASDEYVVFKNKETGEINFEYPTVNKKFMLKTDKTLKRFLEGSQQWAESRGGALIKMKLPKKLQKDILKEPIKISKIDEQTQRLVA